MKFSAAPDWRIWHRTGESRETGKFQRADPVGCDKNLTKRMRIVMAKILLVDDAVFMRKVISDTLSKNGYTDLYEAVDGADAVEKYSEINPDLVIMDITMPNMDGLEALKAIRAKNSAANVVMCSAMGQEAMVIDAIQSGARDFIVKPFKPERIMKTVTTILGGA